MQCALALMMPMREYWIIWRVRLMIDYEKLKEDFEKLSADAIEKGVLISLHTYFTPDGQVIFELSSVPGVDLPFRHKRIL